MNETHAEREPSQGKDAAPVPPEAKPEKVSVKRILLVVVPLGILIAVCAAFFGVFNGADWLRGLMYPPLVHAEVRVTYRGQPVPNALVITQPTGDLPGAMGMPGEDPGVYVLRTDIQGHYHDGAYAGQHKVSVAGYGVTATPAAPPLLTPAKYSSLETTDLVINVGRSAEPNRFDLQLQDDGSMPQHEGSDRGASDPGEGIRSPATVDQMAEQAFSNYDQDGDGKLSDGEIQRIDNEQQRTGIRRADADGDGVVDRRELIDAVKSSFRAPAASAKKIEKKP